MGCYDTLRCGYPLPVPEHAALEFQVKGLCAGAQYVITVDGRLVGDGPFGGTWTLSGDAEFRMHGGDGAEYEVRFVAGRLVEIKRVFRVTP